MTGKLSCCPLLVISIIAGRVGLSELYLRMFWKMMFRMSEVKAVLVLLTIYTEPELLAKLVVVGTVDVVCP